MRNIPYDCFQPDGMNLLILAGHENASDAYEMQAGECDSLLAILEIGVHQVNG